MAIVDIQPASLAGGGIATLRSGLRRLVRQLRVHRDRRAAGIALRRLPPHLLADIGVERDGVEAFVDAMLRNRQVADAPRAAERGSTPPTYLESSRSPWCAFTGAARTRTRAQ